jgi:MoxR-like ATPase
MSTLVPPKLLDDKAILDTVVATAAEVVVGKHHEIKLAFACLLARGHLLIEDLPGVGKTTLAHVLAKVLGLTFQRIQFTSDLLPADILGVSVYEKETSRFSFHPGPIFTQLVLADEVNRATPRTQSALLEAMEEQQVTIEGRTHALPTPFFVVATQNPSHQIGTFPLPESQLDRFLMRIELGYPENAAERTLLKGRDRREMVAEIEPILQPKALVDMQQRVTGVHVSDALIDYLQDLLNHSRRAPGFVTGLSPRAGLSLRSAAQSWALLAGREHVLPEDVQAILPAVVGHRLRVRDRAHDVAPADIAARLLREVPVP